MKKKHYERKFDSAFLYYDKIMNPLTGTIIFGSIAFGLVIYMIMVSVIKSYIKTTFVIWAQDRDLFATNQPEYSQIIDEAMPSRDDTHKNDEFTLPA